MLSFGHSANETFSSADERGEGHSGGASPPRSGATPAATLDVRRGDQVVFDRLDLAEALGIWRHARGRIVGIHGQDGRSATVDVRFEGHEVLERYLPGLFRRVH